MELGRNRFKRGRDYEFETSHLVVGTLVLSNYLCVFTSGVGLDDLVLHVEHSRGSLSIRETCET